MRQATRSVLPFGGDVTQAFDILRNFGNFAGAKIGLFVNLGRSRNPAVEDAVLDEVGSYGRQIGRLADALAVMLDVMEGKRPLPPADDPALADFRAMVQHVALIKKREADRAAAPD